MKEFDQVERFEFYPFYGEGETVQEEEGGYIQYEDYKDLLEAYNDLKWRMEGLEH